MTAYFGLQTFTSQFFGFNIVDKSGRHRCSPLAMLTLSVASTTYVNGYGVREFLVSIVRLCYSKDFLSILKD